MSFEHYITLVHYARTCLYRFFKDTIQGLYHSTPQRSDSLLSHRKLKLERLVNNILLIQTETQIRNRIKRE